MIEVTEDDFNPGEHIEAARTRQTGGIVTFTGIVRDDDITAMDLEAYKEVALEELTLIRDRAMALFQVNSIDIVHRIGRLQVGDH
ncbi:MAG TPA: molybdenum cofactor biosynthesis protein MoaE, partial [Methanoregulaceae archaeon]|nr:molybdenum cofactor biosynthesis protein MoaE [Methanoregulaceae archaeon]